MKKLKLAAGAILFLASTALAQLTINVDKVAMEYYLSGSATGLPFATLTSR